MAINASLHIECSLVTVTGVRVQGILIGTVPLQMLSRISKSRKKKPPELKFYHDISMK